MQKASFLLNLTIFSLFLFLICSTGKPTFVEATFKEKLEELDEHFEKRRTDDWNRRFRHANAIADTYNFFVDELTSWLKEMEAKSLKITFSPELFSLKLEKLGRLQGFTKPIAVATTDFLTIFYKNIGNKEKIIAINQLLFNLQKQLNSLVPKREGTLADLQSDPHELTTELITSNVKVLEYIADTIQILQKTAEISLESPNNQSPSSSSGHKLLAAFGIVALSTATTLLVQNLWKKWKKWRASKQKSDPFKQKFDSSNKDATDQSNTNTPNQTKLPASNKEKNQKKT